MAVIKPRLIVIAGPNGSGKTALTTELRKAYDWADGLIEVNPDVIAEEKFGGWMMQSLSKRPRTLPNRFEKSVC